MSRVFNIANTGSNENTITTPSSAVYNNLATFSWSTWVYPTFAPNGPTAVIFVKDPTFNYATSLVFLGDGTTRLFGTINGTVQNAMSVPSVGLTLNTWSNVVMTFDFNGDKKIHLYVGGIEGTYAEQQALIGTQFDDSMSGWLFGNDTFDDGWTGNLAEMALWNTVLTGPQITAVAASTTGVASIQAANLVGYWHLCGKTSPEPDATSNGNNGVLSALAPIPGADSPGFACSPTPLTVSGNFIDLTGTPVNCYIIATPVPPSGVQNLYVANTGIIAPKFIKSGLGTSASVVLWGNDLLVDAGNNLLDTYYTIDIFNQNNVLIWNAHYKFTGAGPYNLVGLPPLP